ncbi:MAG: hypothetical protein J0L97_05495 [Alphaproteobacteria bacterium]|nr:hypothetical protein [Alphaproteobacteria bacterium]
MAEDMAPPDIFRSAHPRLTQLVDDGVLVAAPPRDDGVFWSIELDGRVLFWAHKEYGSLYLPYADRLVPFHYNPDDLGDTPYFNDDYCKALKGDAVATLYILSRTDLGEQGATPCFAIHVPDMEALSEEVRSHPEIAQDAYASKQVMHKQGSILEKLKSLTVEGVGMGLAMLFSRIVPIPGVSGALRVVARNAVSQGGDVREHHMDSYDYAVGFPVSEPQLLAVLTLLDVWEREVTSVNNFSLFQGATLDELVLGVFRVAGIDLAGELGMERSALMQALPRIASAMYFGMDGLVKRAGEPALALAIPPLEETVRVHRLAGAETGTPILLLDGRAVDKAEIYGLSAARNGDAEPLQEDAITRALYSPEVHALRVSLFLTLQALTANGIAAKGGGITRHGEALPQGETIPIAYEPTVADYQQQAMLNTGAQNALG